MLDHSHDLDRALASRANRRRAAQTIAAAAGSLLLGASTRHGRPLAIAQDGDDDDNSGRGRGRGRGGDEDNSGPGNADDPDTAEETPEEVTGQVPEGSLEVRIVGDDAGDFVPGELTVDVGQSVTFVNVHSDEHTATGSGFDTGIIPDEGGSATVVLDTPGVFPYACQIHPEMTGVIRVRDENGVVPETQTTAQEVPADATTVIIANLAFNPRAITVPTGTTVAWTNDDAAPHTATSTDGAFDSGILDPGSSFSFTFDEPGSFDYVCQLHPQMQGTVIAEGEPSASPVAAQAGATPSARPASGSARLEGVWLLKVVPDNGSVLGGYQALVTFRDDGTVEADFSAEAGDDAVGVLTSGRGEWLLQEAIYRISLIALMNDANQRFAGTATFDVQAQLDTDARVLDGTFAFAAVAAGGEPLGDGAGTVRGEAVHLIHSAEMPARAEAGRAETHALTLQ